MRDNTLIWKQKGRVFFLGDSTNDIKSLQRGVYELNQDQQTGEFFLILLSDEFQLPPKIYGDDMKFVNRVLKSWYKTKKNLGILLNGVKGTGKTITGKIISNQIGLPVILINNKYKEFEKFLNKITQEAVFFVDEYEKIFSQYEESPFLSLMDGALDAGEKKLFLLTTNELSINEYMLQRPSRIRYIKTYDDLSYEVIEEVINDRLVHTHYKEDLVKFISELEIITIDLVLSIIDEVNLHNESPFSFKSIYNIHSATSKKYNVFTIDNKGQSSIFKENAIVKPSKITVASLGKYLIVNDNYIGRIVKVISNLHFLVNTSEDDGSNKKQVIKEFKIEESTMVNPLMNKLAF